MNNYKIVRTYSTNLGTNKKENVRFNVINNEFDNEILLNKDYGYTDFGLSVSVANGDKVQYVGRELIINRDGKEIFHNWIFEDKKTGKLYDNEGFELDFGGNK